MVGPGQSMRWDITALVQNVNLICVKKVYYSNREREREFIGANIKQFHTN